jgi:hypothetical protein
VGLDAVEWAKKVESLGAGEEYFVEFYNQPVFVACVKKVYRKYERGSENSETAPKERIGLFIINNQKKDDGAGP